MKISSNKYKKIIDSWYDGFCEIDLNGDILYYNTKFSTILGYDKKELIGMSFFQIINNILKIEIKQFISKTIENQSQRKKIIGEIKKKNIEMLNFELHLTFSPKSNNKNMIYIGIIYLKKNINEKDPTRGLIENLKEQLKNEKYKNTQVISSISHELRTPLNAIIGFSDLMLETYEEQIIDDIREYIEDIKESAKYLLKLVNNVLNISKIESDKLFIKPEQIYLLDFIKNVKFTMDSEINKKGLKFEILGIDENNTILFDAKMFNEILKNLISNAIKFTEKGKISIIYKETRDNWSLSVKDTGIGIKEKNFQNIFMEFAKVNNALIAVSEGHGLGLALTKKIINLHGGEINVESKLHYGTTFTIKFPKKNK